MIWTIGHHQSWFKKSINIDIESSVDGVFIPYQTCIVDPPLWIIDEVDYHSLIMVFFILEKTLSVPLSV